MTKIRKTTLGIFAAAIILYLLSPLLGIAVGVLGAILEVYAWVTWIKEYNEEKGNKS